MTLPHSPAKVLVAHNVQRHGTGGMARMMESIHTELDPARWQVDYFTSDDVPATVSARLRRHGFGFFVRHHAREAYRQGQPYSIINIHEPSGVALTIGRSRFGSPAIIAMSHGVEQRHWELRLQTNPPGLSRPSLKERLTYPALSLWQSRLTLHGANHVFCLNREDQAFLIERLRLSDEKVTPIYPGVGEAFRCRAPMREYPPHATKLLFSGTWQERKGIRQVVGAFKDLTLRHGALELGILGGGVPEERILSEFPADIRPQVRVIPLLSHTECAELLLSYDVFILPSWFEGTPLALLEAMATGMPVITTATCGMKDVVVNRKNGLLIQPGQSEPLISAIEDLLFHRDLRALLGRNASTTTGIYTWSKTAEVVAAAYRHVLDLK
jgi:glycosyltransferase involved in cell wall biosynthesis